MDEVTSLLADLVAIPSINPMGRSVSGDPYFETKLSAYIECWLKNRGVAVTRQPIARGRDNLLAKFDSRLGQRTILFDAHQDTIPIDGMTIEPFLPNIHHGKLQGRGSCDIKGGLAAMLVAFARLGREKPKDAASVVLACTVDEEFTHLGSSKLAQTLESIDLAIIAEPTRLNIVNQHKGAIRWKVRTNGIACHSSTPHLGDNAIYRMARVLKALERHSEQLAAGPIDPVLGPASLSVGRIAGGLSVNTVPDWCEVEIDRRVLPGELPSDCINFVRSALESELTSEDISYLEFDDPWVCMPPLSDRGSEVWIPLLRGVISRVTHREPVVEGVPYGTDAGPLSAAGMTCVVVGPGDIAQAHTKDEWVDLDQVRTASELYFEFARALG